VSQGPHIGVGFQENEILLPHAPASLRAGAGLTFKQHHHLPVVRVVGKCEFDKGLTLFVAQKNDHMIRLIIETEEKNVAAFRAVAKAVKAKVSTQKQPAVLKEFEEGIREIAAIESGQQKATPYKKARNAKD
jgi:hypothetical protein